MSVFLFLSGVGVGTFVSSLLFIGFLSVAVRDKNGNSKKAEEHQKRTEDLLEARNKIDSKIEQHLSVLAQWRDEHWDDKKGD